ncbi:hypothetical protein AcV5_001567 [Taiwanofungus camphoratus]|nr:hypothetical protein AcV5_001567 [Antrodia cinnamomea]
MSHPQLKRRRIMTNSDELEQQAESLPPQPYSPLPPSSPPNDLASNHSDFLLTLEQIKQATFEAGTQALLLLLKVAIPFARSGGNREAPWYTPWMIALFVYLSFGFHDIDPTTTFAIPCPQLPVITSIDTYNYAFEQALQETDHDDESNASVEPLETLPKKMSTRIPDFILKLYDADFTQLGSGEVEATIRRDRTILIVELKASVLGSTPEYTRGQLLPNVLTMQAKSQAQHVFLETPSLERVGCIVGFGELWHYTEWRNSGHNDEDEYIGDDNFPSSDSRHRPPEDGITVTEDNEEDVATFTELRRKLWDIFGKTKLVTMDSDEERAAFQLVACRLREINEDFWGPDETVEGAGSADPSDEETLQNVVETAEELEDQENTDDDDGTLHSTETAGELEDWDNVDIY